MTRRDISKEALKARRSAIINQLQQLRQVLSSVKTSNFEIDELRELGLKLVRVELAPDKELFQFEPCFFLPQPTSVFLEHPLIEDESLPDLEDESLPDLQRGDRIPEEYSGLRDYGRKGLEYLSHYAIWSMMAYRCGIHAPHRPGNLRDLTPLRFCEYECRLPLHDLKGEAEPEDEIGRGIWYPIHAHLDKSAGTPHAILELIVQCRANDMSLTQGEVSGLLGAMYRWYTLREFRQHAMCPMLVISYMCPKHARIIQAHHDGEKLVLQYSPLMSFENKETAPTSLLMRYLASLPVGLTSNTLCIR